MVKVPETTYCENCGQKCVLRIEHRVGLKTHAAAVGLLLVCWIIPCVPLSVYFLRCAKEGHYYCNECNTLLFINF